MRGKRSRAVWEWMEGSRSFEIAWGCVAALACCAVALPTLWWWLPEHRRDFFPRAVDPSYRLQFWYGIFAMAMAFTNLGCRLIPHDDLPFVHPAFFLITVALVAAMGPRVVAMAVRSAAPAH